MATTNFDPAQAIVLWDVPDASTTVKGIVELATDAETIAQSDTTRAITPSNLAAVTKLNGLVFPISQPYLTGFYGSSYTTRRATCDVSGVSPTNRLYVSVSDASNAANIHSFKLVGWNLIRTTINGMAVWTNSTVLSIAVVWNYVYGYYNNASGLYRFDKDTLANPTLMTISWTALTDNTEIWSDGTYLYNNVGKKYSISWTTATYVSTVSFTSMSWTEPAWSDGTYVYQLSLTTSATIIYRWDVAGWARTTLVSLLNVIDAATPVTKWLVKQAGIDLFMGMFSDSWTSNMQLRLLPTS